MIKRPLVWMAAAFVLGICSGSSGSFLAKLLPVVFFLLILFGLSIFFPYFRKREVFLWILPVFFLLGSIRWQQAAEVGQQLEQCLEKEQKAVINGIVSSVTVYDSYVRLLVEDAVAELAVAELAVGREEDIENATGALGGSYHIIVYADKEIEPGSRVKITGTIRRLSRASNPGQYDEMDYWKAQGVCARMQAETIQVGENTYGAVRRWIYQLKKRVQRAIAEALPEKEAGILNAMLLAEKSELDEEVRKLYQKSGISHILAVSGLHFSLLAMGSYRMLKRCRAGARLSLLLAVLIVIFYGILTGFGVSVQRAAIMLLASFLAWLPGKTYDAPSALSLAAIVILIREPLQLFQAGFLLSFGAVIGILIFADYFKQCKLETIGVSISVQLILIPILLWFYYELPVYSLIFNLLLLPFMSLLLVLAVFIGLSGLLWPVVARFFSGGAYYLLGFYEWICGLNEKLSGNTLCYGRPEIGEIAVYYGLLLIFLLLCRKWQRKRVLLFLGIFLLFLIPRNSDAVQVSYLAVEQGDCAVLQSDDMTLLVDAGGSVKNGSERILVPFLKYYGDTSIEYVFLSHADTDHFCMLEELLTAQVAGECEVAVECLVMPAAGEQEEKYKQLVILAEQAGTEVLYVARGDMLRLAGMEIYCLAPERGTSELGTNENSAVLLVKTEQSQYLFTGDVDMQGEKEMLAWLAEIGNRSSQGEAVWEAEKPCILKVAHHGSRYSGGEAFLEWAEPKIAVISCGEDNSYGHPHEDTLKRLETVGAEVYITWQSGAVLLEEKHGSTKLEVWKEDER